METLINLCKFVGARTPFLTQGVGGNISMKKNNNLYIKASGFRLDAVTLTNGIAELELKGFLSDLQSIKGKKDNCNVEQDYYNVLCKNTLSLKNGLRASMEAGFHAILPKKYVVHFHSLPGMLLGNLFNNQSEACKNWLLKKWQHNYVIIPPEKPGWNLFMQMQDKKNITLFLLQNHGVVIQCDDFELINEWLEVEKMFCFDWKYDGLLALIKNFDFMQNTARESSLNISVSPIKIYFPDIAVFLDRIQKILISKNDGWVLKNNAWSLDKDACELWVATRLLYAAEPGFLELPNHIISVLADMPTEKLRQGGIKNE